MLACFAMDILQFAAEHGAPVSFPVSRIRPDEAIITSKRQNNLTKEPKRLTIWRPSRKRITVLPPALIMGVTPPSFIDYRRPATFNLASNNLTIHRISLLRWFIGNRSLPGIDPGRGLDGAEEGLAHRSPPAARSSSRRIWARIEDCGRWPWFPAFTGNTPAHPFMID